MNRIYRLVWNRALRVLQVASEFAHSHGAGAGGAGAPPLRIRPLAWACALVLGATLGALPPPVTAQTVGPSGGNASGQAGGTGSVASGTDANSGGAGGANDGNGSAGSGAAHSGGGSGGLSLSVAGGSGAGGGGAGGGDQYAGGGGGGGGGLSDGGNGGGGGGGLGGDYYAGGGGGGGGLGWSAVSGTTTGNIMGGNGGNGSAGGSKGGTGTGGGGGGGAGVWIQADVSLTNASGNTIGGGTGGQGGNGSSTSFGQFGGGGGGGGGGVLMAASSQLTNQGVITGGVGGTGGNGYGGRYAGNGGNGGAGVYGNAFQLANTGSITGGNGGATGSSGAQGSSGAGGAGVVSTGGSSITNAGSISGGLSGDGSTRADAVEFSGGGNELMIEAGASFTGNIQSISGSTNGGDVLALAGDTNSSLDAGLILGFASNVKTGSSNWTLTGTGNAGIDWTIQQGQLTGSSAAFAGNLTFASNGSGTPSVDFDQATDGTYGGLISGTGAVFKDGAGTLALTGDNTYIGDTTIDSGTLALTGNGSIADSADVDVAAGATFDISDSDGASIVSLDGSRDTSAPYATSTVNLGANTLTLTNASGTFAGNIVGTGGGLTITGGTETLTGFNSYTGATTVDNATLIGLDSVQTVSSSDALNLDGGTLEIKSAGMISSAPVMLGSGGGTFDLVTGGYAYSMELEGQISGSGSLTLESDGQHSLELTNGDNTYSGGTTIAPDSAWPGYGEGPAVVVGATGALGSGDVTVGENSTLEFYSPGNDANGNPIVVSAGSRTINLDGGTLNFLANTTAGSSTINAGANPSGFGGSIIDFSGDAGSATINNTVAFDGVTFYSGGNADNATIVNDGEYAATDFDDGSSAGNAHISNADGSNTYLYDGADAGTATFTNVGSSDVPADVNSPYDYDGGGIYVYGSVNTAQATMVNNAGGVVVIEGGYGDPFAPSIGSLSGDGNVLLGYNGVDTNGNPIPFTLTLGALNDKDDIIGGVISDDLYQQAGTSNDDSLAKVGTGTLTLDGANTYTGLTEVSDGTLLVGGDATHATAAIAGGAEVDTGATLGGFGSILGTTGVEVQGGGTLAPGANGNVGTLTIAHDLTLDAGSALDFALGAPASGNPFATAGSSAHVNVGGALAFTGTATLNLSDAGGAGPGLYDLIGYGSLSTANCAFGGGTACLAIGSVPAGGTASDYTLVDNAAGSQIDLYDSAGQPLDLWTGSGSTTLGGSGSWTANAQNWDSLSATGTVEGPGPMTPDPGFAIFQGAPGTVTVDDSAGTIGVTGMQFAVDGYVLQGKTATDAVTLVGTTSNGVTSAPIINVGDGTSASAADMATIDAVLAGSDGFTKTDWGTLVLGGANTYTGGTTVDGGTLEIAKGGSPGTGSVTVDDSANENATLKVDSGVSLSNLVVLNNGATLVNAGTIDSDANDDAVDSYTGTATVQNTSGGNISGSQVGVGLGNGGSVTNDAGSTIETTGTASGDCWTTGACGIVVATASDGQGLGGALTLANAGTIVGNVQMDGDYANTVTLTAGGSIAGDLDVGANAASTLTLDGTGTQLYSMAVTGTTTFDGTLTVGNADGDAVSWVIDSNDLSSVAGTTIDAGGTLQVGNGGTAGSIGNGGVADDGALAFDRSDDVTYGGAVSGTGSLTQAGTGTLILTGSNSYAGGTLVAGGTLSVSSDANLGDTAGGLTLEGGTLANTAAFDTARTVDLAGDGTFDTGADLIAAGAIGGPGALTKTGAAYLVLTGADTYTGGTTIDAGTLQVGNDGTTGAITGNVAIGANGVLTFYRSDALDFAGTVSGSGAVVQDAGVLTLDGASGAFSGVTTVDGGTLIVGGTAGNGAALGGNVYVYQGATLGGNGTVGSVDVMNGGSVAPGSAAAGSIGTLTVTGDFTAAQGAQLDFDFGAPGADFQAFGSSDRVDVNGDLVLDGATLNVNDAGGMGPGLYNLFTWGGTLTENNGGLTLGAPPAGQTLSLQTLTAQRQINLIDSTGLTLDVWNANGQASSTQMGGGSGTWSATAPVWTDATGSVPNVAMQPQPGFAVFGGTPGTVTVDDGAGTVSATGLQFATNGYTLTGDTLTLVGGSGAAPVIRVGDGSSAGAAMTATIANVIAGSAGLTKTDLGTLVLTGANTYTGGTFIDGGTLEVGSDANLGAATGSLAFDDGTLENTAAFTTARNVSLAGNGTFDTVGDLAVSGVVAGGGALAKSGAATLTLTGANTYTGATTVSAGTLALSGNGSVAASSGVDVATGATFDLSGTTAGASITSLAGGGTVNLGDRTLTLTRAGGSFAGAIGGTGGLTLAGGTETFTGDNTYTGATTVSAGTLALSGNGSLAVSSGVTDDGTLDISGTASGASITSLDGSGGVTLGGQTLTLTRAGGDFAGAIGGTGGLTLAGGTERLSGATTYTGATTIAAGTLALSGSGSVADSSGVDVAGGATFDLSNASGRASIVSLDGSGAVNLGGQTLTLSNASGSFAGAIGGSGSLTLAGGTETLTGRNTYTGGTTISAGTLVASSTSLPGNVVDNAALMFDQAGDGTFSGALSGNGTLAKTGSGTLILDGDSGAFTGSTTISAGTLEVGDAATPSASLGGDVTVDAGATLRGHGTILGDVSNDGTVWAGGSIGTLTIHGHYTQTAHGTLEVEASPQGAASVLAVDGTASLGGSALVLADAGNWAPRTDYTILTATGGVSGRFASAQANLAFLDPVLSYTADGVDLALERNDIDMASVAQTPNQRAVATALNPLGFDNPVYAAVVRLDAPAARAAFDQLAGQIHAATRTALMDDERTVRETVTRYLLDGDGQDGTTAGGVSVWASTWANSDARPGDRDVDTLDSSSGGLLLGADVAVADAVRVGGVLGSGTLSDDLPAQDASVHARTHHAGLYVNVQAGAWRLLGGAFYGWQDLDTHRTLAVPGLMGAATSAYDATTVQGYVDGSYAFALGHGTLAPFVDLAAQRLHTDAFAEQGPAALDGAAERSMQTDGTLGLRGTVQVGAIVQAHASVGWQHAWGAVVPQATLRFASGGAPFGVQGVAVARNAAAVSAGLRFQLAPRLTLDASYSGLFAGPANDQSGRLTLDYRF